MIDIELVDDPGRLASALAAIDDAVVGVDVERADSDRYYRRAALVQIGQPGRCLLIDAVVLDDLEVVSDHLTDRLAVLHAAENDVVPLQASGIEPAQMADTSVAAALLGLPTGLGPLLGAVLGIELTEDKERFQRADWEARPVPDDMQAYAAGDVVHLPALWAALAARLHEAGRHGWYEQELAFTLAQALVDTRDWTRTKGAGRLDGDQRAVLRSLWTEREAIAQQHDIAPQLLLRDDAMIEVAESTDMTRRDLLRVNRRRRSPLSEHVERVLAAIERGRDADPERRDTDAPRFEREDRPVYDALRKRRAAVAREIGIDSGVLCPGKVLYDAIAADPVDGIELCEAAGLRPWQVEILAEPLFEAYTAARERGNGYEATSG